MFCRILFFRYWSRTYGCVDLHFCLESTSNLNRALYQNNGFLVMAQSYRKNFYLSERFQKVKAKSYVEAVSGSDVSTVRLRRQRSAKETGFSNPERHKPCLTRLCSVKMC